MTNPNDDIHLAAAMCGWLLAAIRGEPLSDFAESFPEVREAMYLRAKLKNLETLILGLPVETRHPFGANQSSSKIEVKDSKEKSEGYLGMSMEELGQEVKKLDAINHTALMRLRVLLPHFGKATTLLGVVDEVIDLVGKERQERESE